MEWTMIDNVLVGMFLASAVLGAPRLVMDLYRARMADPFNPVGIFEKRKLELERQIETPSERLQRMRQEQMSMIRPDRRQYYLRLGIMICVIVPPVALFIRHV